MSLAWLLSWNPVKWKWDNYYSLCNRTKEGKTVIESWTSQSKKPLIGDEIFLIKIGDKPRGIIGHGRVCRESYSAPHYNPERAAKGEMTNHIDAECDMILNYETEKILSQDLLKEILPGQHWSPQGSGIQIRESILPDLKMKWEELAKEYKGNN